MCLEHKATTDPAHNCYYCQERCECIADDTNGCLGCDDCTVDVDADEWDWSYDAWGIGDGAGDPDEGWDW